jgi:hypothetical protein
VIEGMVMNAENTWDLPFGSPAELELHTEWGELTLLSVEPGEQPRMELHGGASEHIAVAVDRHDDRVRVRLEPQHNFAWFGGWDCKATLHVPPDVRAHVQTSAGSVRVRNLSGCELGIKTNAGKIDLINVHGVLHLAADAGTVMGRDVGGYLNVETQAGSVRMQVTELLPGDHRVRATMGEVRLELARGMDVCIETHTALGSIRTRYPSRQSAPAKLQLSTEMGSLRVDEGGFNMASHPTPPAPPSPPTPPARPAPPASAAERPVDPELERILKMVEAGELSAREADDLLQALGKA